MAIDIKYGPYLPIGPNGTKKQVFLVAILDDVTRFVLHCAFYPTLDSRIVEDTFRQAIQNMGYRNLFILITEINIEQSG
nr:hypothetical protein [Neobacillus sp. Marseille-Q6967]